MGLGDSIGLELACRTMGEKGSVRAGRWTGGVLFYSCVRAGGEEGGWVPTARSRTKGSEATPVEGNTSSFIATTLPLIPITQLRSTVGSETRPFLPGRSCGRSRNRAAGRHGRGGMRPTAPGRLRAHRTPRHRHLRHGVQSVQQGAGARSFAPCGLSLLEVLGRAESRRFVGCGVAPRWSPLVPRQRDTREVVAVKCVSKRSLNRASVENLLTEIEILKTIRHPHIVELKDFQVGL